LAKPSDDAAHFRQEALNRFGPRSSDLAASSSRRWPASVILIRPTAIALPVSLCTVASPADELGEHLAREAVDVHDCFGGTERAAGEQSDCSAPFAAEMIFLLRLDRSDQKQNSRQRVNGRPDAIRAAAANCPTYSQVIPGMGLTLNETGARSRGHFAREPNGM